MGRHEEHTVPYFPLYVKDGDTLFILEDKYECRGTGFFDNVLRFLSDTPDHHYCIADFIYRTRFFRKVKCDEETGMIMLNIMVRTGKLDKRLWEEKQVIACQDFLDSIRDAYRRRTNDIITMDEIYEFYGLTPDKKPKGKEPETLFDYIDRRAKTYWSKFALSHADKNMIESYLPVLGEKTIREIFDTYFEKKSSKLVFFSQDFHAELKREANTRPHPACLPERLEEPEPVSNDVINKFRAAGKLEPK